MKPAMMTRIAIHSLAAAALAFAWPASASDAAGPRTIRVSGHGTAKTPPDRGRIAVSVTTRAASAREATETNARISKEVLAKLRQSVAAPGEVGTAGYDLQPLYDYGQDGTPVRSPKITGYSSTNRFAIVTADLAGIGALIDAAIAAGANQIDSVSFFLADEESARQQALTEAGRKARAEAETVARSLDVRLGDVLDASSATTVTPLPMFGRATMAMEAAAAPTEVVPGSLEIGADVTVTFAIP